MMFWMHTLWYKMVPWSRHCSHTCCNTRFQLVGLLQCSTSQPAYLGDHSTGAVCRMQAHLVACLGPRDHVASALKRLHGLPVEERGLQVVFTDASCTHKTTSFCVPGSTLRTANDANSGSASSACFLCWTPSLEQPVSITA